MMYPALQIISLRAPDYTAEDGLPPLSNLLSVDFFLTAFPAFSDLLTVDFFLAAFPALGDLGTIDRLLTALEGFADGSDTGCS
jgi:hypothetical protein